MEKKGLGAYKLSNYKGNFYIRGVKTIKQNNDLKTLLLKVYIDKIDYLRLLNDHYDEDSRSQSNDYRFEDNLVILLV